MEDTLISFETAKLAKEKGFNELCYDCYNLNGMLYSDGWCEYIDDNIIEVPFDKLSLIKHDFLRPTQSLLQKWLRDVHNIFVETQMYIDEGVYKYMYVIKECLDYEVDICKSDNNISSNEKALEGGLQNALKLIK